MARLTVREHSPAKVTSYASERTVPVQTEITRVRITHVADDSLVKQK